MPGVKAFGCLDPATGLRWIPIAVNADGKVLAYDETLWIPNSSMIETWQDETGIDPAIWTVTDPATGVAWHRGAVGAYLAAQSIPNANETARLRSNQRWITQPDIMGTNTILSRLRFVFEMQLAAVANMDNALTFFGLTQGIGDTRATNNVIGFGLNTDVLETVTDDAGVETTNTTFGETLTDWNKFRIDITSASVAFYLNETLIATHITNLPDVPSYLNWFVDTEAGGAATINISQIIALMEVTP